MATQSWRARFWWQWVAANAGAEFAGLGAVAALGYVVATRLGEPDGPLPAIAFALFLVCLGAFEGLVVGLAQAKVLRSRIPSLDGWVSASVVGAVVAWVAGMVPSTVMRVIGSGASAAPPEISEPVRLVLAAGLGLVAGPILAYFQWRCLRGYIARGAAWWLPANAAAWAFGMPVVFVAAHVGAIGTDPALVVPGVGLVLLAAGAVVGAIHGAVLVWLLSGGALRAKSA